ncbi:protein IMPACT-like [Spodoptera litura]|uniref:Protein IMPACT-like n=1 Tax=Spodoptera litura TaxID=69820 RepID=A0A9J7EWI0_SPOLT|nr:protein IMPACT-like [Spodoptera litura]
MPEDFCSMDGQKRQIRAASSLRQNLFREHRKMCCVSMGGENKRSTTDYKAKKRQKVNKTTKSKSPPTVSSDTSLVHSDCPEITHGEVIVDRKSIFQGHAAEVHSIDDVNAVLTKLKMNKKICNAKHNMYAYRIERKTGKGKSSILQDCDNDGEAHAGGRMLHLMQILDQKNTLVVVTRWYGGIQLGPDRFRHINNATRQAIEQAGLLKK